MGDGAYYGAGTITVGDDLWRDAAGPVPVRSADAEITAPIRRAVSACTQPMTGWDTRSATRFDALTDDLTRPLQAFAAAADRSTAARSSATVTLSLAMVNWLMLMALLCAFLLAKTLPADTALTDGGKPTTSTAKADRHERR